MARKYETGTMTGEQKAHYDKLLAASFAPIESDDDRVKRYRRERAIWSLEGMMTWCLEHGEETQLEALTNLEIVLNELMSENALLRASSRNA